MGKALNGRELGKGIGQRKDGTYCGRYVDRFGKRHSIYNQKLGVLRIELAEAICADRNGGSILREPIALDDWFEKWLKVFKSGINESTVRIYRGYYYKRISPVLGMLKVNKISEMDIRELLLRIKEEGYAHSTIVKVKKILTELLEAAVDNNFALSNPAKKVKVGKDTTPRKVHALTRREQRLLLEYSKERHYYNAYVFQLCTGVRPGELFALSDEDIDFGAKTISIKHTLLYQKGQDGKYTYEFHNPKTATSQRIIPMSSQCEEILKEQLKVREQLRTRYPQNNELFNRLIFTSSTNTPLNTSAYNSSLKKVISSIRKDGFEIKDLTGHGLRHTFATRCFESGINPKTIQTYMGHSSLQMTMDIYTELFKDYRMKEIDKLDVIMA